MNAVDNFGASYPLHAVQPTGAPAGARVGADRALYSSAKVAGVRGFFRSDDAGRTWIRINDDRHQYANTGSAITGDPRVYGRVYVGTNGRGVIYGDPTPAE